MLFIGSDHGGYKLKEEICRYLDSNGISFNDLGIYSEESCDYPDVAEKVCKDILSHGGKGILFCGTGIGMSIAANKYKGIRAAVAWNEFTAEMAAKHNDANILCLGGRVIESILAKKLVDIFLNTSFEGGRHKTRIDKIKRIEEC
ncbi:MAG: ribose 5-phosphate isomerase B [archaeon]